MLVVDLIFVVIGIVYVIYKLVKEEYISTQSVMFGVVIIISMAIGGMMFDASRDSDSAFMIVISLIFCVLIPAGVIICMCLLERVKARNVAERNNAIITMLCGEKYNLVRSDITPLLIIDQSPANKSTIDYDECYRWLCEYHTKGMWGNGNRYLNRFLGININTLPLDESVGQEHARKIRAILLKHYILTQRGLKYLPPTRSVGLEFAPLPEQDLYQEELYKQLELVLAKKYVLQKTWTEFRSTKYVKTIEEYESMLPKGWRVEEIRKILAGAFFNKISDDVLERFIINGRADRELSKWVYEDNRSGYWKAQEAYGRICEYEMFRIASLSADEFDELLGMRLEDLPLDDSLVEERATERRAAIATHFILMDEGLQYVGLTRSKDAEYGTQIRNKSSSYYKEIEVILCKNCPIGKKRPAPTPGIFSVPF